MSPPAPTPVRITTFPLNARHLAATGLTGLVMLLCSSPAPADAALARLPAAAAARLPAAVHAARAWLFRLLVCAHAAEVPAFALLRLRRHGVGLASALALAWLLAVFVGGKATWDLWAGAVAAAEKRRR